MGEAALCPPLAPLVQVRLQPVHVLQCHSKLDSCDDFSTQLWSCSFQPQQHSAGTAPFCRHGAAASITVRGCELGVFSGAVVATCGGDTLCLIDCESGMVMKKYKVAGEVCAAARQRLGGPVGLTLRLLLQEFFSLAWSSVLMSRGDQGPAQPCSILAAGGKRGVVKLIHPRNNLAYGEFRASRKSLSVLRFHERQGNLLFSEWHLVNDPVAVYEHLSGDETV